LPGAEGERHLVAGPELLSVQLGIAHDGALEALRRGVEAQRLLDRGLDQPRIGNDAAAGVGMIVQIERRACS